MKTARNKPAANYSRPGQMLRQVPPDSQELYLPLPTPARTQAELQGFGKEKKKKQDYLIDREEGEKVGRSGREKERNKSSIYWLTPQIPA